MLGCWGAGVLGCWGAGVLGCWGAGVLGCWGAGVLGCWGAGAGAVPAVGHRRASDERRGNRCAPQVVGRGAVTGAGLASDATPAWLCDARREGAAPVHERRSPLRVFLVALFRSHRYRG
ncbi:hypothetical protein FOB31_23360 [Burkholderia multivorans]|nr:hypothetical protein FOB31_23360 [Burkholderia multivorans]QET37507.1 hypothetical protein FOB30_07215 [Burkholderia multivorans]